MADAHCTSCGHEWTTQKEPSEMEDPRCSECRATRWDIEFAGGDNGAGDVESEGSVDAADNDLSIGEKSRRNKQKAELLQKIELLLTDLRELAPDEKKAPPELRGEHAQLTDLQETLDSSEYRSKREMDEINDELQMIRGTVESHDDVERIDDTIAERKEQIEELDEWVCFLEESVEELHEKKKRLEGEIEDLEQKRQEKLDALELVKGVDKRP